MGIDTSCYTTSVAAVNDAGEVIAFARKLLPVAFGDRGLRQSEAVFAHVKQIAQVAGEALTQLRRSGEGVAAICVSSTPRDEEDSYMPVFSVGESYAGVLSDALRIPLYRTSHQQGHIAAGMIGNEPMGERFVALHLSGGTTELLHCDGGRLSLLGGSLDLHAGQLVDRVGVRMGLDFPAGPALEKLAMAGKAESLLPVSMEPNGLNCHLSGAEAQALRILDKREKSNEDVAAEVFDLLGRTVARLLASAARNGEPALVVGGVASSTLLRDIVAFRLQKLRSPLRVVYGQPRYSADNAAGVAMIGRKKHKAQEGIA